MNLFHLLDRSEERLAANDPAFNEQTEVVQAILKAVGALPFRRAMLNGALHKQVAASIVLAAEAEDSIDIPTRRAGTLHEYGYSTKVIEYLDKAVSAQILQSKHNRAEGAVTLGPVIQTYLAQA